MTSLRHVLCTLAVVAAGAAVAPAGAQAAFGFSDFDTSYNDTSGNALRQAGSHGDLRLDFKVNERPNTGNDEPAPAGQIKDLTADLPRGFVGNPTTAPTCTQAQLAPIDGLADCPVGSQVGIVRLRSNGQPPQNFPIYNMERPGDLPALFAFNAFAVVVRIEPRLRPGDYGISTTSLNTSQGIGILEADVTLWGVPADPSHDAQRFSAADARIPGEDGFLDGGLPSQEPRRAFLSAPATCTGTAEPFTITSNSWEDPATYDSLGVTSDINGIPYVTDGCDKVPFAPSVSVKPLSRAADAPTGLDVNLSVPQDDDPDGLASAPVRKVTATLPPGMSVSPSSAAGLGACAPGEIGLGTDSPVTCPDSSKIGSVQIDTPLLDVPLTGDVILARQYDNPFRSLLAVYIVARGPGVLLKLPGRIDANQVSGQLTATFDNTPQLPFSNLRVTFKGGSQAPLANAPSCGTYTTRVEITSWASTDVRSSDSPMTIDQNCSARGFDPALQAGTTSPLAGTYSPFSLTVDRPDGQQELTKVSTTLPRGLLAKIAGVPQCSSALADAGKCPASSRVGSSSVLSGPGAAPLSLGGNAYLTGPYAGAPFGLAVAVSTAGQAGPFDLGTVVVRLPLRIDPGDAHVSTVIGQSRVVRGDGSVSTLVNGQLPSIIEGFPLRLRRLNVNLDRRGFTVNPTSCASTRIVAALGSLQGSTVSKAVPFNVGGCKALRLAPKLGIRLSGKGQFTDGGHPALKAVLTQPASDTSNLKTTAVKLPLSLALDPTNSTSNRLCEFEAGKRAECPKSSIVGTARVRTPLLSSTLTGPVYFVKNVRVGRGGRKIRTLPTLLVQVQGQGVKLNLRAKSSVAKNHLVTTFAGIPDAPVSRFELRLTGGKRGILVANTNVCKKTRDTRVSHRGQNGGYLSTVFKLSTPCKR